MCEFCEDEKVILEKEAVAINAMGMYGTAESYVNAFTINLGVFIDRGCLRLADMEDCQCLDHGDYIKIKFCPFCGVKIKHTNILTDTQAADNMPPDIKTATIIQPHRKDYYGYRQ